MAKTTKKSARISTKTNNGLHKATTMFRQGDVIFKKLNVKPAGEGKQVDAFTVALGEVTGHSHQVLVLDKDEDLTVWETGLDNLPAEIILAIEVPEGGATIRHDEHGPIHMDPGVWGRVFQVELTEGDARVVAD